MKKINGMERVEMGKKAPHTEINVPGKKTNVTSVMILIDTVSFSVFFAIFLISSVIFSILSAEICDFFASRPPMRIFL